MTSRSPSTRLETEFDRRFYRRKYDASQTLAEFAEAARSETDMDRLSGRLIGVVQGAMEPAHVELWLKAPPAAIPHVVDWAGANR